MMDLATLLERAKGQLSSVTGLKPVTVIEAHRDEEGWHVGIEMLEMPRIPPATDVLGQYETLLGEDGDLLRFERKSTRLRGEPREAA